MFKVLLGELNASWLTGSKFCSSGGLLRKIRGAEMLKLSSIV